MRSGHPWICFTRTQNEVWAPMDLIHVHRKWGMCTNGIVLHSLRMRSGHPRMFYVHWEMRYRHPWINSHASRMRYVPQLFVCTKNVVWVPIQINSTVKKLSHPNTTKKPLNIKAWGMLKDQTFYWERCNDSEVWTPTKVWGLLKDRTFDWNGTMAVSTPNPLQSSLLETAQTSPIGHTPLL